MKLLKQILAWISNAIVELSEQLIIIALIISMFIYLFSNPEHRNTSDAIGVFAILAVLTLLKIELKIWGVFRALGILILVKLFNDYQSNIQLELENDNSLNNLLWVIVAVIAIIGGEIALYLHKLTEFMICPRCVGKGFVDKNDITRLGMEGSWSQGYCRYCDGKGKVDVGKTKRINPKSFIGPSSHESDTPGN